MKIRTFRSFAYISLFVIILISFFSGNKKGADGETVFRARVEKIINEQKINTEGQTETVRQDLVLVGLEKDWKNKEIDYKGISNTDSALNNVYRVGDKVHVSFQAGENGGTYYIVDFVRTGPIYWLAAIFAVAVILVGKRRGLKSLLSLFVSFFIIIKILIPGIVAGNNILMVALFSSFAILCFNIYLTEGVQRKSHLAIISVFFSLLITFVLSWFFSEISHLTGYGSEEAMFLSGLGQKGLDLKGLLLAGILVGAIGVLDDVVIGQIETVQQLLNANRSFNTAKLFKSASEVGNAHLGAIVNTLFLTYTGASLPLLLLFNFGPTSGVSFTEIVSNELIATEIIRTLVGSIGVALSVPIATYLAARFLKPE